MIYILALLIGVVAGLRAMTAPAAVSWAASLGLLTLDGSWLAFLGYRFTPWILTLLAVGELITDQLPSTPSRKVPIQFATRVIMGGLSGAAIGASGDSVLAGLVAGAVGVIVALPAARLTGIELALATGAFAVILDRWVFSTADVERYWLATTRPAASSPERLMR